MLWMKALHIVFVVCWFAGLFYLPRIFVYYAASEHDETRDQLAVMARRLYRFVTPFMYILIALGVGMFAMNPGYYLHAPWFWLKMCGMAALIIYHFQCGRYVKALLEQRDRHSHTFFRFFNEIPVVFLFAMVILAVLKPF